MKELLKELSGFFWNVAKEMPWQKICYDAYTQIARTRLQEMVKDSESKMDDVIFAGIDRLVESFLKPKA